MNKVIAMINNVATTARKAVLLGALVGGVSMASYATETTETTVGPTIEKAQLETVNVNLEAVVAAITKADPDWVKGLPGGVVGDEEWYLDPNTDGNADDPDNYVLYNPSIHPSCDGFSDEICTIKAPKNELTNKPILDPSKPVTVTETFYSPTQREL